MKRTLILLILLIAGAILAYTMYQKKGVEKSTSYDPVESQFAVEDINKISRVFISDRSGLKIDLKRKKEDWILNDKYLARQSNVDVMLEAVKRVKVKFMPRKAAVKNIAKNLASAGIKVEIFGVTGSKIKTYYIGGGTQDERGTYYILEDSNQPYAVHIPGFEGNLRARFNLRETDWRSRRFLNFEDADVNAVKVNYPYQPESSFTLDKKTSGFEVSYTTKNGTTDVFKPVPGKAESYISAIRRIACENYINEDFRRDSISRTTPFCELEIQRYRDESIQLRFFPTQAPISPDVPVHRYFVDQVNGDFMLGQFEVMKAAFRDPKYFLE